MTTGRVRVGWPLNSVGDNTEGGVRIGWPFIATINKDENYWREKGANGPVDPELYAQFAMWAQSTGKKSTIPDNDIGLFSDLDFKQFLTIATEEVGQQQAGKMSARAYLEYLNNSSKNEFLTNQKSDKNPNGHTQEDLHKAYTDNLVAVLDAMSMGKPPPVKDSNGNTIEYTEPQAVKDARILKNLASMPGFDDAEMYYAGRYGKVTGGGNLRESEGKYYTVDNNGNVIGRASDSDVRYWLQKFSNGAESNANALGWANLDWDKQRAAQQDATADRNWKYENAYQQQSIADKRYFDQLDRSERASDRLKQDELTRTQMNNDAIAKQADLELRQAEYLSNLKGNESSWIQAWKFQKSIEDQQRMRQPIPVTPLQTARQQYDTARYWNDQFADAPQNTAYYQQSGVLQYDPNSATNNLAMAYQNLQKAQDEAAKSSGVSSWGPMPRTPQGPLAPDIVKRLAPQDVNEYGELKLNQMSGQPTQLLSNQAFNQLTNTERNQLAGYEDYKGGSFKTYTGLLQSLLPRNRRASGWKSSWQV